MAIDAVQLGLVMAVIRRARKVAGERRLSTLCFGYPDLVLPHAELAQIVGAGRLQDLPERRDAEKVRQWHNLPADAPVYDSIALFDRLGLDVTIADVAALQGMERIVDLNDPLPDDLRRYFDLVIDPGTCEHCFNVGMAFRNVCEAVAPGGFLVHIAPLSYINHGFWNFSPTVYPDYFEANGFALLHLAGHAPMPDGRLGAFAVDHFQRFSPPPKGILYVAAERTGTQAPVWPVQRKYRPLIG
jgi:SAM-dependent methyltransferase